MLLKLRIKNFALIGNLELTFKEGFSVITGETGAGKSILIDAISYVLGTKFNKEFIRTGEESASVEATFECPENVVPILAENDIPVGKNSTLTIQRENSISGKSIAMINGVQVQVGKVKDIYPYLLDIHGQHNNQNLLNSDNHAEYLDRYGNIYDSKEYLEYTKLYGDLKEKESKLNSMTRNNERDKIIDYLAYQIKEITDMKISETEENELTDREKILSNSQKISDALSETVTALEDEKLGMISHAVKQLKNISSVIKKAEPLSSIMEEAYFNLDQVRRDAQDLMEEVYFDQSELDEINERLYSYGELKKKYGRSVSEILEKLKDMETELWELEHAEELIKKIQAEINKIKGELLTLADALNIMRKKSATALSKKINAELKFVGLGKADFEPYVLREDRIMENGMDSVRFMISTNTGEPKKPLEKIVSGGELSRIMLAMKAAFIDKDQTPTVIFDEIDIGISGRVAEAVGQKMYSISKDTQVLCVTHLPQIASWSDNHYIASKKELNGRTFSEIRLADEKLKTEEIAGMISGAKVTEANIKNAVEMIETVKKYKE
ncbi:MAG: DNA repair protein RecN [Clostridiaceae bacterium]